MVDACKTQGVAEPDYEETGGFVRIVFKRKNSGVIQSESESKEKSKENTDKVYRLISENRKITTAELGRTKHCGLFFTKKAYGSKKKLKKVGKFAS